MNQAQSTLTTERFAQGMTFDEYLSFIGSQENLRREGSGGEARRDWSGFLRGRYQQTRLTEAQVTMLGWLGRQPNGPARILMIAEEWSSDCRRDLPIVQRMAEAAVLDLRIFTRDGGSFGAGASPNPDSPNADLMKPFLRRRGGQTFQSIPIVAFFTHDGQLLYHYLEFPAVYHKDHLRGPMGVARPGETPEQTRQRASEEYAAMLGSPMFDIWADAAVAEMVSLLYERICVGSLE